MRLRVHNPLRNKRPRAGLPIRRQAGLTLIELLVALTILIGIMLAFSTILNQSRRVVTTSQRAMRSNAAAAAIIDVLQRSLRHTTQQGFLCIMKEDGNAPELYLTTAGAAISKTSNRIGTGSLVRIGLVPNANNPSANPPILYCQTWVLDPVSAGQDELDVLEGMDLSAAISFPRILPNLPLLTKGSGGTPAQPAPPSDPPDDMLDFINYPKTFDPPLSPPQGLTVPPDTIGQVNALWQVLASKCEALSITWTDGKIDPLTGNIEWYGVDYYMHENNTPLDPTDDFLAYTITDMPEGEDAIWQDRPGYFTANAENQTPPYFQFNAAGDESDGYGLYDNATPVYCALFTHHNQRVWPNTIRIRFRLIDENDANEVGTDYEVICPVGR